MHPSGAGQNCVFPSKGDDFVYGNRGLELSEEERGEGGVVRSLGKVTKYLVVRHRVADQGSQLASRLVHCLQGKEPSNWTKGNLSGSGSRYAGGFEVAEVCGGSTHYHLQKRGLRAPA